MGRKKTNVCKFCYAHGRPCSWHRVGRKRIKETHRLTPTKYAKLKRLHAKNPIRKREV